MDTPKLEYRDWDYADGINHFDRSEQAMAKLKRLGCRHLAHEAMRMYPRWNRGRIAPDEATMMRIELEGVARMLVLQAYVSGMAQPPWRLFVWAAGWYDAPEDLFPAEWRRDVARDPSQG